MNLTVVAKILNRSPRDETSNSKPYLLPYGWCYRSYADSNYYIGEKVMRNKRGKPKVKVAQYSLGRK